MKKILYLIIFLLSFSSLMNAQQLSLHTQYMTNDFALNPAIAGTKSYNPINLSFRRQWVGIREAPVTEFISMHGYYGHNLGIGGQLYNESVGPTRRTGASLSAAYHLTLSKTGYNMGLQDDNQHTFSFGLSFELNQLALDMAKLIPYTANDPTVDQAYNSQLTPDMNFGLFYHNLDKYYFGFSVMNLFQGKSDIYNIPNDITNIYVRNYYLTGGATLYLKGSWTLLPSFLVQGIETGVVQFDIGARAFYDDKYWIGVSYRHQDAVNPMIGVNFDEIRFGYSYDITISQIKNYSFGSHELICVIILNRIGNNEYNRSAGKRSIKKNRVIKLDFKPEIYL